MTAAPRTDWVAVWILFAGGLAAGAHMTKVPPALPVLRADLGLSLIESGFIHTTMYAIGAALAVFGGALADRYGQKRFALIGLALMTAGDLAGAAAQGYAALLASRFFEGLGFILFTVAAAPLLASATLPADRATAFGLWGAYMPTGGTLALLAAPVALAGYGWRSLWLGLALVTALCALALARRVPRPSFGGGVGTLRLLAESLARPGALWLCVAFICYVGQWTSLMTWLPTFAVEERGASEGAASLLLALFVAVNIPGNLLGGLLLKRGVPRAAVMAGGAVAMGLGALGVLWTQAPDALRLASLVAFSFLGGVIPASVMSGGPVHAKSPQHIGTTNGMIMQASHLSQFVVPILVAWVASRFGGWQAASGTLLGLAALGVVAALAVGRFERRLPK